MTVYNDSISKYIIELFAKEDEALQQTYKESIEKGFPAINIKPEEGRFLQFLVRVCGAKKALEIGTLGGYSTIWLARGLPPGGQLTTLEIDPTRAEVAREHFALADVLDCVQIQTGDAHQILPSLETDGPFGFIFIDAEKSGYPAYFDWALNNIPIGGVIAMHNAFRKGSVAGIKEPDEWTELIQAFNKRVAQEKRLLSTIYPAGDGTLIAVKTS